MIARAAVDSPEHGLTVAERHAKEAQRLEPENQHFASLLARIKFAAGRHQEAVFGLVTFLTKHQDASIAAATLTQLMGMLEPATA